MEFKCPHCGEKGISGFGKFMSKKSSPAVCKFCGMYSCESVGVWNYFNIISTLGFPLCLGILLFTQQYLPSLFWIAFIVIFPFYALFKVPLSPLADVTVMHSKIKYYISLLLFVLFVIYAGLGS